MSTAAALERQQAVNQHLRLLLDHVKEGVMLLEQGPLTAPGPGILFCNAAAGRLTGKSAPTLHRQPLGVLLAAASLERLMQFFHQAAKEGSATTVVPICGPQGEEDELEWRISTTKDSQGRVLHYMVTLAVPTRMDRSGPVRWRVGETAALPTPQEYHEDLVINVKETARRVAHEFNNALTAIRMPLALVEMAASQDLEVKDKLDMALHSTKKAAGLAKDFLDCFRPRVAAKETVQLPELLSRTLRLATLSEHVKCQLDLPEGLHAVIADPEQLDRVIFNLVRNACDAMDHQGLLTVRAVNSTLAPGNEINLPGGDYVSITVRDYGPGIREENLRHLFHSRFTTKPHGNGCGLPICYQIIKEHGGEMFVSSLVNVGTAFAIFLPAVPLPAPPHTPPRAAPVMPAATVATPVEEASGKELPSLLIVDDDDQIRSLTSLIIRKMGYDVESAAAGEDALNIVRTRQMTNRPLAGVLMDINLQGRRNGVETLREIHQMDHRLPIIATSGDHGDPLYYRSLGFRSFLAKPYGTDELREALSKIFSS